MRLVYRIIIATWGMSTFIRCCWCSFPREITDPFGRLTFFLFRCSCAYVWCAWTCLYSLCTDNGVWNVVRPLSFLLHPQLRQWSWVDKRMVLIHGPSRLLLAALDLVICKVLVVAGVTASTLAVLSLLRLGFSNRLLPCSKCCKQCWRQCCSVRAFFFRG